VTALRRDGIAVRALTRDPTAAARRLDPEIERFGWDGVRVPADAVAGTSGVVHLAGEPVFAGRLTRTRRRRIRTSRVESTRSVVEAFGALPASERPAVFACASAVGFYGSRGEEQESSAFAAEARGVRTVALRIGIALAREGGALPRMALPFRLGAGGRLGSGRQWFPWIHIDDLTSMVESVLRDDAYRGPVNAVAPEPVRNAELTRSLASALGRPALLAVPAFALRLALGELSEELLGSRRVVPRRALDRSFSFAHPSIATAIAEELRAGEARPPGDGDPVTRGG
jgi:NAD dependent epimerase/dehydratase family enzyme